MNDEHGVEKDKRNGVLPYITNRLLDGVDVTTIQAKYMVGCDTSDDNLCCYILARKVGGVTEILLEKKCRINNKVDKDQFEADINKLAEYFNCEVRGD